MRPLAACLILSLCVSLVLPGCRSAEAPTPVAAEPAAVPVVRVRVAANVDDVTLQGGPFTVAAGDRAGRAELPTAVSVRRQDGRWLIGDRAVSPGPDGTITLRAADPASLRLDGERYRGLLRLVPKKGASFDVVNHVDLETYLRGVVTAEMPGDFPPEALAAQAVASRTYAIYMARTRDRGHYDLSPDTGDQVYGGITYENAAADAAIEKTRGVVLAHDGRIFKSYFHSTAGGETVGVDDALAETLIPPLSAQSLGDFEADSPHQTFEPVRVGKADLTRRFQTWGRQRGHELARIGDVRSVEVAARTPQGRPARFTVVDATGKRVGLLAEELRWATNTTRAKSKLKSSHVEPVIGPDTVTFTNGRGWGHGVGMSQWAAEGMARAGMDWRAVLRRSYPAADLVQAWK